MTAWTESMDVMEQMVQTELMGVMERTEMMEQPELLEKPEQRVVTDATEKIF